MKMIKMSVLDSFLDEISPQEQIKTDARMMIAASIDDAMKRKGWKNKDLMIAVGQKHPSVITKWLSGTHNFTIDTLVDLEIALNISLINRDAPTVSNYKTKSGRKSNVSISLGESQEDYSK